MKTPTEMFESQHGLFIVVPQGVYKYDPSNDCFKKVKFCDENGTDITSRIGTGDDDPRNGGN